MSESTYDPSPAYQFVRYLFVIFMTFWLSMTLTLDILNLKLTRCFVLFREIDCNVFFWLLYTSCFLVFELGVCTGRTYGNAMAQLVVMLRASGRVQKRIWAVLGRAYRQRAALWRTSAGTHGWQGALLSVTPRRRVSYIIYYWVNELKINTSKTE